MGKKIDAIKFEKEVKDFLSDLKFQDVNGASDQFKIGGIQVDVCGGHENTLLIIECTMQQELGAKSIRDKITEIRGESSTIEKGLRTDPIYKKYKDIKYVLAIKNIQAKKNDIEFANYGGKPRVYIWDDNLITYYSDLYAKIKEYAKYNLLGEIGIKPSFQNTISVPAFLTIVNKIKMYSFLIDPKDLLEVSYVARRETRNERYYQRLIEKKKLKKIAEYINNNNILPNNLIISFGEHIRKYIKYHVKFQNFMGQCTSSNLNVQFGILEFPRDYRSCWIIDGQHRLYAFVNVNKFLFNMPIIAFEGLNIQDQCKIFLDINKNQKPVPPDLVWDLNGDMIPSDEDGIISNTVKALNNNGPLQYKIFIPLSGFKRHTDQLKIASICLGIKKNKLASPITFSKTKNPNYDINPTSSVKNISDNLNIYFEVIKKLLPDNWKLGNKGFVLTNGGIRVLQRIYERILSRIIQISDRNPNEMEFKKYLSPLTKLFIEKYSSSKELTALRKSVTSEAKVDEISNDFIRYISKEINDPQFSGIFETPISKKITDLEKSFKEILNSILKEKIGEDWFESIHDNIRKPAEKRWRQKGGTDKKKIYLQITLGECFEIMRKFKKITYPVFVRIGPGFGTETELEAAISVISRIRQAEIHYSGDEQKLRSDESLFEIYHRNITDCIKTFLGT